MISVDFANHFFGHETGQQATKSQTNFPHIAIISIDYSYAAYFNSSGPVRQLVILGYT
ncbi:MAG: hypothetical protein JST13_06495 [Bacteroidetes bacterium]|nr:hypothetical protein [Bacteroidota bacterium]